MRLRIRGLLLAGLVLALPSCSDTSELKALRADVARVHALVEELRMELEVARVTFASLEERLGGIEGELLSARRDAARAARAAGAKGARGEKTLTGLASEVNVLKTQVGLLERKLRYFEFEP